VGACAIDFGTSNSAVGVVLPSGEFELIELEPGQRTLPTAVFYFAEDGTKTFGRKALGAYVDGYDGRLMRSMKSLLGSDLIDQTTEIGGLAVPYMDVIIGFLRHLKQGAEAHAQKALGESLVLGRPVFFVDGDAARDRAAEATLARAARIVGFRDVEFQLEPIAAALDYETQVTHEELILVADIGGGTSDFSVIRVGPERRGKLDRRADVLANHGVHTAGTDFDQSVNLASIMPHLGLHSRTPDGRVVPNSVYFELSTWHLINTVYAINRTIELKQSAWLYAEPRLHARLMQVIDHRYGHQLMGIAEAAKIALTDQTTTRLDLDLIETELAATLSESDLAEAVHAQLERVLDGARQAVVAAGLTPAAIDTLYFTGGSTGLRRLTSAIAGAFSQAKVVYGDRYASVASGLARHAQLLSR
jgi:hypothetical chaperone protein